jgi:hypothetical protein
MGLESITITYKVIDLPLKPIYAKFFNLILFLNEDVLGLYVFKAEIIIKSLYILK